jgi:hypothetical protein
MKKLFEIPRVAEKRLKEIQIYKRIDLDFLITDILSYKKKISIKDLRINNGLLIFTSQLLINLYCLNKSDSKTYNVEHIYPINDFLILNQRFSNPVIQIETNYIDINVNRENSKTLIVYGIASLNITILDKMNCFLQESTKINPNFEEKKATTEKKRVNEPCKHSKNTTKTQLAENEISPKISLEEKIPRVVTKVITDLEGSTHPIVITLNTLES